MKGPAHAVYFATYEAVKHAMGGNQAGVHHPLAAGESFNFDYRLLRSAGLGEWNKYIPTLQHHLANSWGRQQPVVLPLLSPAMHS